MENKMAKFFKDFINEATASGGNQYNSSVKIIRFLEKKLACEYFDYDCQDYTNQDGNFFGYLFINKEDNSSIRINWEGNKFNSINFWQSWNYNVNPTIEIKTKGLGPGDNQFTRLLPDIADIIAQNNAFDNTTADEIEDQIDETEVNESVLNETGKFQFNGEIYNGKQAVVRKMYDEERSLDEIKTALNLNPKAIKEIIAKYIKEQGGSVKEVATALNVSNIEARELCGEHIDEEGNVTINPAITVLDGSKETLTPTKQIKTTQEYLENTKYADPDLVFDELTDFVTLIGKGMLNSLIVTGDGSIGKSFNADKILDQFGKKNETWVKISGKQTLKSIYTTLWENRDKIVVFEDCDGIFKDAQILDLLNTIFNNGSSKDVEWHEKDEDFVYTADLDDNAEIENRVQDWSTNNKGKDGIPSHFIFNGGVILISKLKKLDIFKKDSSLLSKCTCIDIMICAEDVLKRMETILTNIRIYKSLGANGNPNKEITDETLKQEIFDFIKSDEFLKNPKIRGKEINIRLFNQVYKLKWSGLENWKELAFSCGA